MTSPRTTTPPPVQRPSLPRGTVLRRAAVSGAVAGAAAAVAGVAVTGTAAHLARRIVTPVPDQPDDVEVLGVGAGTITLRAAEETRAPGRYGLWQDGGSVHVRVGEIVDVDVVSRTVTRRLDGVDRGRLHAGSGRWNQYYYAGTPRDLGLEVGDDEVATPLGAMPAWRVPPAGGEATGGTWAVLVHGRNATREECLRALPLLHTLGLTSLVVSYRNDAGAPRSPRGRYRLGDAEWVDVEAAIVHALEAGARDVVLLGWSMGAAIALQTVARSWLAPRIRALVLDAPVVDWRDVLVHQARVHGVPAPVGALAQMLLEHPHARRFAGLEQPVPLDRLDWVSRAAELRLPTLILHSEDDAFVPAGPSRRLAQARPDLVTYVPFHGAAHTREWNVDPQAWEGAVARFLLEHR
ncbi:MAG: alpha/beta fold hydrolase [Kineosporiaceae bacterium]